MISNRRIRKARRWARLLKKLPTKTEAGYRELKSAARARYKMNDDLVPGTPPHLTPNQLGRLEDAL